MPGPIVPALLAAGSALAGQGINAAATSANNKQARRFAEYMHNKQRQESLADYQMQNDYNHPSAQMERLKAAGLNPNLVYGNGATTESASIKPAPSQGWSPTPPQVDLGGAAMAGINAYYDSQIKSAQVDNLRTQNTVLEMEATLKEIQSMIGNTDLNTKTFDLGVKEELRGTTIESAKWDMQKTLEEISQIEVNTMAAYNEDQRRTIMQAKSLEQMTESILQIKASTAKTTEERNEILQKIELLKKDNELKKFDVELSKLGIRPQDKIGWRIAAKLLGKLGISL